jgi:two-component system NtrC family sensor kinase
MLWKGRCGSGDTIRSCMTNPGLARSSPDRQAGYMFRRYELFPAVNTGSTNTVFRHGHEMPLRTKISLILLAVFILYAGLDYGIQRLVVFPSFVSLEHQAAKRDLERCVEALRREIYHLDTFNHDWAAWDDTYAFVRDRNSEYIQSNLVAQTFVDNNLNLIYVCDGQGTVVWGEIRDVDTWQKIQLAELSTLALPLNHILLAHGDIDSSISGTFMTELGPLLVSSRPIVTTNNEGPIRGTLIMGRFLSKDIVQTLVVQTRVNFQLWPTKEGLVPMEDRDVVARISPKEPFFIREASIDTLHAFAMFPDIRGTPALLLRADVPKEITAQGTAALRFATLSLFSVGLLVLVVLWILLRQTVLGPIGHLTARAVSIGRKNGLPAPPSVPGTDEIRTLTHEFDHMVEQLAQARKRLTEQSYYSGMAEMASGVLHNLRNTLNPMIVDVDILRQDLLKAPVEQLRRATDELSRGTVSSERRKDLIRFAELAYENLTGLVEKMKRKLDDIGSRIVYMEEVLTDRDEFRCVAKPTEDLNMMEIVEEAVALMPSNFRDTVSTDVDQGLATIGLQGQRIPLVHVVANILVNAAESIERTKSKSGRIQIKAQIENQDGTETIHLTVRDNGAGIAPGNLERIFQRGFTTKDGGSWGIGLHWSANTIAAMNGKIYAESPGPGEGACLHLLFPKTR